MEASHLVLNKETVKKVLSAEEIRILDVFIAKVRDFEGKKSYIVHEKD